MMSQSAARARAGGLALVQALLLVAVLAAAAPTAMATVFTVTSAADSGAGTLRDALAAAAADANGPHTITMALGAGPATITLTTALALPNTRTITVDGTLSGGARVGISGAGGSGGYLKPTLGTPENAASVLFANVDFSDLGFVTTANELALTNVSMTSTRPASDNLKAVAVTGARLTLRSVRIEGFNTTASGNVYGAAVDARTSSQPVAAQVDAADLTVVGCTSQYGPAIFAYDQGYGVYPTVACVRCALANNTSVSGGGGAVFLALAQATFHQSLFTQNSALGGGSGGALGLLSGAASATVTRSYFVSNFASGNGGAIYSSAGTLNVRNSAVVDNTAAGNGGALYLTGAQFVVHSLTALNNTAAAYPGIYLAASSGASNVTNSILYGAASASALYASATGSASVRLTKNIIKGYSNTGSCPSPGLCATGTIDADPQLVQVFEAQADGSPVDTFWVPASGCSPAVNSGDNTGGDAVDMRGAARVVGASVDRGAVEFVPSGANVAPTVTGAPSYSAVAGSALVIAAEAGLLSYACDPNGDPLTASLVSPPSPAGSGAVAVNADGSFTFTPAAGFTGAASFMFSVSDGALSAQGAATINVVAGPNSPPTATAKTYRTVRNNRVQRAAPGLLDGATDPNTGTAGLTATNGTFATLRSGTVIVQANGAFVYAPPLNFVGADTFTFTVRDPSNAVSAPATVTVTIDAPAPAADVRPVVAGVSIDAQVDATSAAAFAESLGPPTATVAGVSTWSAAVVQASVTQKPDTKAAAMAAGVVSALKQALNSGVPPLADGTVARAVTMPAFSMPAAFASSPQASVSVRLEVPVSAKMPGLELESAIAAVVADTDKVMPAALRAEVGVRGLVVAVAPALTTCDTGDDAAANGCVCAPGDGGSSCNRCGAGKFSPGGSDATCNACVGDTYAKAGASECGKCAAPGATADKSACRKAPVRAAPQASYTASRMARLREPAPGLLKGVTSDFALTASLKNPSQNGVTQEGGSSITVNADGSFVYTPPTRKQERNATIEFHVTDANGDALEATVPVAIDDKPPALAAPTLQSINFTECNGRYNPRPQCIPGRVLASPKFTAGALELLSGDGSKAHGTPNGIDIRILVAPGAAAPAAQGGARTECIAPLPKLKVGAGGAAPRVALRCPGCKRCLRKLGLGQGDSFMAAVRARKAGKFPASEWSSAVPASL